MNLQFHWYGFIVGLALVIGWWLVDAVLQTELSKKKLNEQKNSVYLHSSWLFIGVGTAVGARLWHVITDWSLYQNQVMNVLAVWQGGLSIVGAVVGGVLGFMVWWWFFGRKLKVAGLLLDSFTFGLPVAQAVGRIGNYLNQELYGWPTSLPWGIQIAPENRLMNFESFATFHPLFAYEMIAMIFFWIGIFLFKKNIEKYIGTGLLFSGYIAYYSLIRFTLDWLRPYRGLPIMIGTLEIGLNQVAMIVWFIAAAAWWGYQASKKVIKKKFLLIFMSIVGILFFCSAVIGNEIAQSQRWFWIESQTSQTVEKKHGLGVGTTDLKDKKYDRSFVVVELFQPDYALEGNVNDSMPFATLRVEVVNTPESMSQGLSDRQSIGSDGMVFIFQEPRMVNFWMRRMHFNLDMVWIRGGRVISVTPNVPAPPPATQTSKLPTYSPPEVIDTVLELPAGTAQRLGIEEGIELQYSLGE